jgi:hypothetical protein
MDVWDGAEKTETRRGANVWRRMLPAVAVALLMVVGAYTGVVLVGIGGAQHTPARLASPGGPTGPGIAPLAGVPPSMSFAPITGPVGTSVFAQLKGMLPNTAVTVKWNTSTIVCSGTTGPYGGFGCTFTVPTVGAATYTVTGTDGSSSPTATFKITPTGTVTPSSAPAGTYITAGGNGFAARSTITVKYAGQTVCTTTSNASGRFLCTFPTFATASEYPTQYVNISDASSNKASVPFTVTFPSSEAGTFYGTTGLALPPLAQRSCDVPLVAGACTVKGITLPGATKPSVLTPYINVSNDPVLNYTSTGTLALAYTSYTSANAPCASARPYSLSNIVVETSANYGSTWTAPVYLGTNAASACTGAMTYPSAWEPAITSLSNGTLVLAYIEYNTTLYNWTGPNMPPYYATNGSEIPTISQLVVTESYPGANYGTKWTPVTVLNLSHPNPSLAVQFPPAHPSITAFGNTIYLTWMSMWAVGAAPVLGHAAFIVSTNGGGSWSPTITLGSATVNAANPDVIVIPSTIGSVLAGTVYIAYDTSVAISSSTGIPSTASVVVAKSAVNGTLFTTTTVASGVTVKPSVGPFFNPAPVLSWTQYGVLDVAYIGGIAGESGTVTTLYYYTSVNGGSSYTSSVLAQKAFWQPSMLTGGLLNTSALLTLSMNPRAFGPSGTSYIEATIYNGTACTALGCGVIQEIETQTSNNGTTWQPASTISGYMMPAGNTSTVSRYLIGEYTSVANFPNPNLSSGYETLFAWTNASCPSYAAAPGSVLSKCTTIGIPAINQTTIFGTSQVQLSTAWTGATTSVAFTAHVAVGVSWSVSMAGLNLVGNGPTTLTVTGVPVGVPIDFNLTAQGQYNASYQYRFASSSPSSPATFTAAGGTVIANLVPWVLLTVQVAPSFLTGQDCTTGYGCLPSYFPPPAFENVNLGGFPGLDASGCGEYTWAYYYGTCRQGCTGYIYDYDRINAYEGPSETWTYRGGEWEGVGCVNSWVSHNTSATGPGTVVQFNTPIWVQTGTAYNLSTFQWSPLNELCGANSPVPTNQSPYNYQSSQTYFYLLMYCDDIQVYNLQILAWFGSGGGNVTSTASSISVVPTGPVTEIADFGISSVCTGSYIEYVIEQPKPSGTPYTYFYNSTVCTPYTGTSTSSGGGGGGAPVNFTETGLPAGTTWGITLTSPTNNLSLTSAKHWMIFPSVPVGTNFSVIVNTIPDPKNGEWWVGTAQPYLTSPDFNPVTVTFTLESSLASQEFAATVTEYGLPQGAGYSFTLHTGSGATTYPALPGWTARPVTTLTLPGSSTFSLNGTVVYTANGTGFYVSGINVSFASINSTSGTTKPGATLTMLGVAALVIQYAPEFRLTVQSTTGGTASPGSEWVAQGQPVTLTATPNAGELFTGWTGYGTNGSITTHSASALKITVSMNSPITEIANFRAVPQPTYTLTVSSVGLPAGLTYSILLNGIAYSGNGSFPVTNLTAGSYTVGATVVYNTPVPTTRWVPVLPVTTSYGGSGSGPVTIASDGTATITFTVQYELSVSTTGGGTVNGTQGGPWYDSGASVTLLAQPNPGPPGVGYYFVSWNGTGPAAQTGKNPTIVLSMTSPVTELAQFLLKPVSAPRTFILTVEETGLPTGLQWNATVGALGNTTTGATATIMGLNGTYTLNVPVVAGAPGVRYWATPGTSTADVLNTNLTVSIVFSVQYLLTVSVAGNGTTTMLGSQWVNSSATVTLSASTSNVSWAFESWKGTSTGATPSLPLTITGPTSEVAQFTPVYKQGSTGSTYAGAPIAIGLLIALLVIGIIVAYAVSRRGGGGGMSKGKADETGPQDDGMTAETAEPSEAVASPADDGAVESEP